MNELGETIKNNKSFFDMEEPPSGHFDRFDARLTQRKQKTGFLNNSMKYLKVASVALLIILSSLWVLEQFNKTRKNISIALGEISPEYKDVEIYYTQLYESKLIELNEVNEIDPELEAELFNKEFKELDSIYQALQKELGYNNEDERIINAMIGYYQTKVEILNQIINQLNEVKSNKENNENNETEIEEKSI